MPSEEQVPAMDIGLPEKDHLPDWMSQLFDKLDAEVEEDGSCSTDKVAQVDIHQPLEHGISSDIPRTSKDKDSITAEMDTRSPEEKLTDWLVKLFELLELRNSTSKLAQVEIYPHVGAEVVSSETRTSLTRKDSVMAEVDAGLHEEEELPDWMSQLICSTEKVANAEGHPLLEHGISSEINKSSTRKGPVIAKVHTDGSDDEDEFDDWMLKMMRMGANDDMSYLYIEDQEDKHQVCYDQLPDYDLMDEEVEDYPKNMRKFSYKETIENGFKWMKEECFLAFTKYAEKLNFEGIEHRFGEICHQCFSVESYGKTFHHFNFTIEAKDESNNTWISELYFAEVKQESGTKSYFCHRLEPSDKGHCNGCTKQDMSKLQHPSGGGYQEGGEDIYWPFEVDTDSESDTSDDCDIGYLKSVFDHDLQCPLPTCSVCDN